MTWGRELTAGLSGLVLISYDMKLPVRGRLFYYYSYPSDDCSVSILSSKDILRAILGRGKNLELSGWGRDGRARLRQKRFVFSSEESFLELEKENNSLTIRTWTVS